jgi:gluconokinase
LDADRLPIGPIYTWADVSAGPTVELLKADLDFSRKYYQKTGHMIHAMYPFWKYYHLLKTAPELIRKVRYISSQVEYVYEGLTGEIGVSKCITSASGFFNAHTMDWDEDLLAMVDLDPSQFSPLRDAPHWAGLRESIAKEVGLPVGLPVTVGFADGAMNQVGIGGDRAGIMSFSVGTSAAIRMVSLEPKIPDTPSTWCYYLYKGKRLVGASTQGACSCVDWFLNNLPMEIRSYDRFETEAAGIDIMKAPYFLPFLFGERCPGWQDQRLGGFFELRPSHRLADLYFAVLEGILFNVFHCYKMLTVMVGEPEKIVISGGIMNSKFWLQMAADIFGRELLTTGVTNDSTVGAAVIGIQAAGGLKQASDFEPALTRATPSPSKNIKLYQERFQKYLELYRLTAT